MARDIKIPVSALSRPGKKKKNVPILSHEFIQENHADIVSIICMLMVFGLLIEITRPICTPFVAPQHLINDTDDVNSSNYTVPLAGDEYEEDSEIFVAGPNNTKAPPPVRRFRVPHYGAGPLDMLTTVFYTLVWVVIHAVFKEYFWDRFLKPLRLSKAKTSVYFESCNLATFYLMTTVWALYVAGKERLLSDVELMWRDYPHVHMTFRMKIFLLLQIGYWVHNIPELYFLKAKKDEIMPRVQMYILHAIPVVVVYSLHFQRIAVVLLAFHATAEFLSHLHTLLSLWRESVAAKLVPFWGLIFGVARLFSVALTIIVFGFGLAKESGLDLKRGNYNTLTVRMGMASGIILLQLLLVWQFVTGRLAAARDRREREHIQSLLDRPPVEKTTKKSKKEEQVADDDEDQTEEAPATPPAQKQPRKRAAAAKGKH